MSSSKKLKGQTVIEKDTLTAVFFSCNHDNYQLMEIIGEGRCCQVFKCQAIATKKLWAVKVYSNEGAAFENEKYLLSEISGKCNHIVNYKDYGEWKGHKILVQELLDISLKSVAQELDERKPSQWLVYSIARHLSKALDCLYKEDIVHADIKPGNVMWCGDKEVFKLIDLGVGYSGTKALRYPIQSKGYQAPEVIAWNRFLIHPKICLTDELLQCQPGHAADVWTVGAIVYEIVFNKKPNPHEKELKKTLLKGLKEISTYSENFKDHLLTWLELCLTPEASERAKGPELINHPLVFPLPANSPTLFDLSILPMRILYVQTATPISNKNEFTEIFQSVDNDARCAFHISESCRTIKGLLLKMMSSHDAKAISQQLKRWEVAGWSLVTHFYPQHLYEEEICGRYESEKKTIT